MTTIKTYSSLIKTKRTLKKFEFFWGILNIFEDKELLVFNIIDNVYAVLESSSFSKEIADFKVSDLKEIDTVIFIKLSDKNELYDINNEDLANILKLDYLKELEFEDTSKQASI